MKGERRNVEGMFGRHRGGRRGRDGTVICSALVFLASLHADY
jgi:hypothetical protein